jgi:predicted house-cleaning noncanonical NTP pyrophosphatase (MazG superfamily)
VTEKLVRDRIPDLIRSRGGSPRTRIAGDAEYRLLLRDKLAEETAEVLAAADEDVPGELADVLEVVLAIAADLGVDAGALEELRAAKHGRRGGFAGRVVWRDTVTEDEITDERNHR